MHRHQPCGSNPRLIKIEPWLTHITEPPSLYTSPTAHVSTTHLFSLCLGASVFLLYPISIHTSILTKLIAPFISTQSPIYFPSDLDIFHLFLRLFRDLAVKKRSDRSDFRGFAIQSGKVLIFHRFL